MQLTCPNCGEKIRADQINIQTMMAVCSACDNVFTFNTPEAKIKRRKVSQPEKLAVREDDHLLHMAYRTNFRLDKNESFLMGSIMSMVFTIMTMILWGEYFASDVPFFLPLVTSVIAAMGYYFVALTVWNKTDVKMDDESIRITRRPLPNIFDQTREINLSSVVSFTCEETATSKKEEFDLPRYHVWAERVDGSRQIVVADVIESYGIFVAQRLQERLQYELDPDVTRLTDDQNLQDVFVDEVTQSEFLQQYDQH